jgi:hypothetical protein
MSADGPTIPCPAIPFVSGGVGGQVMTFCLICGGVSASTASRASDHRDVSVRLINAVFRTLDDLDPGRLERMREVYR